MTVLEQLAELVVGTARGHRALVSVDGVDGSGKTTLADALARRVEPRRAVARASVDDFHRPAAERYRRGGTSAEGCYRDTFDHQALCEQLLLPFRRYVAGEADAVLVVDGVFLQRPELDVGWDLVIHLQVPDEEVLRRVVVRDEGDPAEIAALYRARYLPAQRLYEAECRPAERAQVVLDNTDPQEPVVLRWPEEAGGRQHGLGHRPPLGKP